MSRILDKKDIEAILYGAAFLSTGGGGPLKVGLKMLEKMECQGPISLELLSPEDMDEDGYAATAIGFGSPDAFDTADFGMEAVYAFRAYREHMLSQGISVKYLSSLEFAGFNTFTPMLVAIKEGLPFLDTDLNAKAIPELNSSLCKFYPEKLFPIFLSNAKGDVVAINTGEDIDIAYSEKIILDVARLNEMKLGLCNLAMSKKDIRELTSKGAISLAEKVGRVILEHKASKSDFTQELNRYIKVKKICQGTVSEIIMLEKGKFNTGTIVIEDKGKKFFVDFTNETMIVRDDSHIIMTVPDLICLFNPGDFEPITCSEVRIGTELTVWIAPALSPWKRNVEEFEIYRKYLDLFKYTGEPVLFEVD